MKLSKVTKLPAYLKAMREDTQKLFKVAEELNYRLSANEKGLAKAETRLAKNDKAIFETEETGKRLDNEIERLLQRNAELEHMVAASKQASRKSVAGKSGVPATDLFAENHDLDAFYLEFENRFRGTEAEIQAKQEPYVKLFKDSAPAKKLPVADLGCGRGEFLELLAKNGLHPVGVDLNESMVERAKAKGFTAFNADAISYLMKQESGSLAGVTGFHLAEHIPFDQLLLLIAEAYRCLAKGGILLLETPNPESLFVGAFTFHYDPSHLKPLPPAIVQFAAEFKGFERANIMRRQPELSTDDIAKATKNPQLQGALQRLYGPRDYALVAYK